MAADSTIKPRPAPQFSLRLIFGITLVAAVMFALLRWAASRGFENDLRQSFDFSLIWGAFGLLILAQLFCTVWAWPLLLRWPDGPISKRKIRRYQVLNGWFGIGALPVALWLSVTITAIVVPDEANDVVGYLVVAILIVMAVSLPFKVLAMMIYGGSKDELPVVLVRLTILMSTIYPFMVLIILLDIW